jgi:flagellar motility protein MotE (MotC chaperone)
MTVFLRWGALALVLISALVYAYRVNQKAPEIAAVVEAQREAERAADAALQSAVPDDVAPEELPEVCAGIDDAIAAGRAAAESDEPLDRALRQSVIAFESDPRRKLALEAAATRAYEDARAGRDRDAEIAAGACSPLLKDAGGTPPAAAPN